MLSSSYKKKECAMFRSILIDDFMTQQLVSTTADTDLLSLVDVLLERGISGAPVLAADGKLVGMISEHDCLRGILVGTYQGEAAGRVGDVMSREVDTIVLGTNIVEAATHMVKSGRRRLVVVDSSNRLVGQISRHDLLRAVRAYEIPEEAPRA
jgi:predicted transcriptional regulator